MGHSSDLHPYILVGNSGVWAATGRHSGLAARISHDPQYQLGAL
jgi:hypothetical protein